jgi:hypothetical protein
MKEEVVTFESILDGLSMGSMAPKDVSIYKYQAPYGRSKDPSQKYLDRKAAQKASYHKRKAIKEALNIGHKLCTACGQEKTLASFNVDKRSYTGYSSWCKDCHKDKAKHRLLAGAEKEQDDNRDSNGST